MHKSGALSALDTCDSVDGDSRSTFEVGVGDDDDDLDGLL